MTLSGEWVECLLYWVPLRKIPERTLIGPGWVRDPYPDQPAMVKKVGSESQASRKEGALLGEGRVIYLYLRHMYHTHSPAVVPLHVLILSFPTRTALQPSPTTLSTNASNILPVLRFYPQGPILVSHPLLPPPHSTWDHSDFPHPDPGENKKTKRWSNLLGLHTELKSRDEIQAVFV